MKYSFFSRLVMSTACLMVGTACSQRAAPTASTVSAQNVRTNTTAVDESVAGMRVTRLDVLKAKVDGVSLLSAESGDASAFLKKAPVVDERTIYQGKFPTTDVTPSTVNTTLDTLIVGLPIGDLGEERILGGVITAVSATTNANLGNLKLSDFPMLHGKLMLAALETKAPQLLMVGCASNCQESSPRLPLIAFPITAVDSVNNLLMVDLSAVGHDLDLIAMEDPTGQGTGLKSTGASTTAFDYSEQTVVFDVVSKTKAADPKNPLPDTDFTVRWYLRSSAAFDSAFTSRDATAGVGFFMTETSANPKIKRWSLAQFGPAGIKYYLKHIPTEWQPAFASAFDEWNATFTAQFGRKIFDYEFIPENDPRNALLVTGDIRYNIVEWDLVNLATYGGLGPCESNEYTGETISANVLIQGPTIMQLYTDWYKVTAQAKTLADQGQVQASEQLLRDYSAKVDASLNRAGKSDLTLNRARSQHFTIHAEKPELADPYAERNDFDELPPNVDFKTYMNGYFHDMLTHELGHNLGLRHNFRGNMGATDTGLTRSTSRSVMEYLGRRYRYLDGVGPYDIMALSYGYTGVAPKHTDWFCTDEDKWALTQTTASPECSADDATSDPYSFFEMRLARSIDYLTARGNSYAPVWTQDDLTNELTISLTGLLSYATVDTTTENGLTNFFGKAGRPTVNPSAVETYVVAGVKQQLCDPNLDLVVAGKYDQAAKAATQAAIVALRDTTIKFFTKAGVNLGFDNQCAPVATPVAADPIAAMIVKN